MFLGVRAHLKYSSLAEGKQEKNDTFWLIENKNFEVTKTSLRQICEKESKHLPLEFQ